MRCFDCQSQILPVYRRFARSATAAELGVSVTVRCCSFELLLIEK